MSGNDCHPPSPGDGISAFLPTCILFTFFSIIIARSEIPTHHLRGSELYEKELEVSIDRILAESLRHEILTAIQYTTCTNIY